MTYIDILIDPNDAILEIENQVLLEQIFQSLRSHEKHLLLQFFSEDHVDQSKSMQKQVAAILTKLKKLAWS